MANSVAEGSLAPDFELTDDSGKQVRLSGFRGKSSVVVYFYPKDETPGCTKEACTFRDQFEVFKKAGAEVIGISSDSVESHKQFKAKYRLPFTLLSDVGGNVRKLYGVKSTFGILPGRVTFIIDKQGVVRKVFSSQLQAARHVDEALNALKGL